MKNKFTFSRAARALPESLQHLSDRLIQAMDEVVNDAMAPGRAIALSSLVGRFIQQHGMGVEEEGGLGKATGGYRGQGVGMSRVSFAALEKCIRKIELRSAKVEGLG